MKKQKLITAKRVARTAPDVWRTSGPLVEHDIRCISAALCSHALSSSLVHREESHSFTFLMRKHYMAHEAENPAASASAVDCT